MHFDFLILILILGGGGGAREGVYIGLYTIGVNEPQPARQRSVPQSPPALDITHTASHDLF